VTLLADVYSKFLPFMVEHPNFGLYDSTAICPKCGSKDVQWRGFARAITRVYRRFQCNNCSSWGRTVHSEKGQAAQSTVCV
jgi:hypothetical protein